MDPNILVVEDEGLIRTFISKSLSSAGYQIIQAEDGLVAYQLIQRFHNTLKLVITDIQMPRMNGAELAARISAEYPGLKILCMSGYMDRFSPAGHYFLSKPFTYSALRATVDELMRVSPLPEQQVDARRQVEPDLYARLVAVRAKLDAARKESTHLEAMLSDVVDAHSDGRLILQRAESIRVAAFRELDTVLREWSEFLLDKSKPPSHI